MCCKETTVALTNSSKSMVHQSQCEKAVCLYVIFLTIGELACVCSVLTTHITHFNHSHSSICLFDTGNSKGKRTTTAAEMITQPFHSICTDGYFVKCNHMIVTKQISVNDLKIRVQQRRLFQTYPK